MEGLVLQKELLNSYPFKMILFDHCSAVISQITSLAIAGYRVIAPDLRGMGETTSPYGNNITIIMVKLLIKFSMFA